MGLETATYVSQLTVTNPTSADAKNQGDDHIRLLKSALKNTFPGATSAVHFDLVTAEQVASIALDGTTDGGNVVPVSAAGGARTVTLPATPTDRLRYTVVKTDYSATAVTISGNGKTINGQTTLVLRKGYQSVELIYSDALGAWIAKVDTVVPVGTFLHNSAASVSGYVLCDGVTTLGNSSSSATLQSAFHYGLYEYLYNTYSDAICPVSGGRVTNAAADYAVNKRITMPLVDGCVLGALDATGLVLPTGTALGKISTPTKTLIQANLPNVTVPVTITDPGHSHGGVADQGASACANGTSQPRADGGSTDSATTGITAVTQSLNGGVTPTPVNVVQATFVTYIHMAL